MNTNTTIMDREAGLGTKTDVIFTITGLPKLGFSAFKTHIGFAVKCSNKNSLVKALIMPRLVQTQVLGIGSELSINSIIIDNETGLIESICLEVYFGIKEKPFMIEDVEIVWKDGFSNTINAL